MFTLMERKHKQAEIRGTFVLQKGRTVLIDRYHQAPFKITKTFHMEKGGQLFVYMMDASPGMMNGDRYSIQFTAEPGTEAFISNQSFTKVHPSMSDGAVLKQRFQVGKGALLEFFPEPLIPYAHSRFTGITEFDLKENSTLLYADIVTPGRTGRGEVFQYASLSNRMEVRRNGLSVAWDHFQLEPSTYSAQETGAFEQYTHMGSFWIFSDQAGAELLAELRERIDARKQRQDYLSSDLLGTSLTADEDIVVRLLGNKVCKLQEYIKDIWDDVRELLLGKSPHKIRK